MSYHVTVKCPRCLSTSQLKAASVISGPFLCPVCGEGEIEYRAEPPQTRPRLSKVPPAWEDLITVYSAPR